jgi:predicted enzyme related to lactoylglutathione lyase
MIGYTVVGAKDLDRALGFYDQLFAEIGGKRAMDLGRGHAYGFAKGPMFGVMTPHDGQPAHQGNGHMIALNVGSKEKVDAVHARALALGGTDEGAPGPRGTSGFYGAYFRDSEGNKLCAFCMG